MDSNYLKHTVGPTLNLALTSLLSHYNSQLQPTHHTHLLPDPVEFVGRFLLDSVELNKSLEETRRNKRELVRWVEEMKVKERVRVQEEAERKEKEKRRKEEEEQEEEKEKEKQEEAKLKAKKEIMEAVDLETVSKESAGNDVLVKEEGEDKVTNNEEAGVVMGGGVNAGNSGNGEGGVVAGEGGETQAS
jgi:HD superfamily phosphohydrolase